MTKILFKNYIFESSSNIPEILYHGSNKQFDKFEINHSDLGKNGLKYGIGVYLTDSIDLAEYYASGDQSYVYECKIPMSLNLIEWDDNVEDSTYLKLCNQLSQNGFDEDSEKLLEDYRSYGDTVSANAFYNIIKDIIGSKKVNELFLNSNIDGFISNDIHGRGRIYTILNPTKIKILSVS